MQLISDRERELLRLGLAETELKERALREADAAQMRKVSAEDAFFAEGVRAERDRAAWRPDGTLNRAARRRAAAAARKRRA